MKMYDVEKVKLAEVIKCIDSMVSFTTDIWTAPTQIPFFGITAHFIVLNWNLHCKTLDFKTLSRSHTGEMLLIRFLTFSSQRPFVEILSILRTDPEAYNNKSRSTLKGSS
jgi:hypothetical protein